MKHYQTKLSIKAEIENRLGKDVSDKEWDSMWFLLVKCGYTLPLDDVDITGCLEVFEKARILAYEYEIRRY